MNVCVVIGGGSGVGKAAVAAFGEDVVTGSTGRSDAKAQKCRMS